MKVAFGCHLVALVMLCGFGATYLFRAEFMPYHAVAVGMPWAKVPVGSQALFLGLMKATGGASLAIAVLISVVLFIPFRSGAVWARWTIPGGGLLFCATTLYAQTHVALHSPATPPMGLVLFAAGLLFLGLLLSVAPNIGAQQAVPDGAGAKRRRA
jgi:hypothetical protein